MTLDVYVGQSSVCDFCNCKQVVKVFYCADFVVDDVGGVRKHSIGDWMSCQECAALVEAHDIDRLIDRQVSGFELDRGITFNGPERENVCAYTRRIAEGFFQHYTGTDDIDEV